MLEPQIGQSHKISQVMEEFLFRDSNADLRLDTCAGDVLENEYDQLFLATNTDQSLCSLKSIRISTRPSKD